MLLCFLIGGSTVSAQSTSKEINNIKRNTSYIYAEATMENEADASEVAFELLMQQVQEYIGSKQKLSEADNVLIKDIKTHAESLSMMRGEMHRVFVYVKKSDIEGVMNTTVVNNGTGATITVSNNPTVGIKSLQANETTIAGEKTPEPTAPAQDEPTNEPAAPQEEMVVTEEVAESADANEPQRVEMDLAGWRKEAVETLLACNDITAVKAKLNIMKSSYKVKRYGAPDNCPNDKDAFWIIFDAKNGKVAALLGIGENERIEYKSMTYSRLDAYKGMNAIWFTFAK